jgi:flagellar biogenesis protein FliO
MFQRIIDDIKASTGAAMRQTALATAASVAFLIAFAFLCAAGFVVMRDQYGIVEACLAGAGLFLVIALIVVAVYAARKRQVERRAAERTRSTAQAFLSDPVMVATGIQIIRAIGVKRLLPILAVGGLALGLIAGRSHMDQQAGDQAPAE